MDVSYLMKDRKFLHLLVFKLGSFAIVSNLWCKTEMMQWRDLYPFCHSGNSWPQHSCWPEWESQCWSHCRWLCCCVSKWLEFTVNLHDAAAANDDDDDDDDKIVIMLYL